ISRGLCPTISTHTAEPLISPNYALIQHHHCLAFRLDQIDETPQYSRTATLTVLSDWRDASIGSYALFTSFLLDIIRGKGWVLQIDISSIAPLGLYPPFRHRFFLTASHEQPGIHCAS